MAHCLYGTLVVLWLGALPADALQQVALRDREDACTCLNWKEVYDERGINCGEGAEMYQLTIRKGWTLGDVQAYFPENYLYVFDSVAHTYCRDFFKHIDDNFCMNVEMNKTDEPVAGGQWCYVSPECQNLAGGRQVPKRNLSWKTCSRNHDTLLRDKTIMELDKLRKKHNVNLGTLVQFAYPVWQHESFADVENSWADTHGTMELLAQGRNDLVEVKQGNAPVVFVGPGGKLPYYVVIGTKKRYEIKFKHTMMDARALAESNHLSKVTTFACIEGCEEDGLVAEQPTPARLPDPISAHQHHDHHR